MREPAYAKGAARREEMLTAAVHVIAGARFKRLSLREIARALDVEAAHLVYYFGSRDGLLQAVIERWDADTLDAQSAEQDHDRPLDYLVAHVRLNAHVPGLVHLLHAFATEAVAPDHPAHDFFRARYEEVTGVLEASVEAEIAAGLIPATTVARAEAKRLIALSDGLQLQALLDDRVDATALLTDAVEQLRSLAVDPYVRAADARVPILADLRRPAGEDRDSSS